MRLFTLPKLTLSKRDATAALRPAKSVPVTDAALPPPLAKQPRLPAFATRPLFGKGTPQEEERQESKKPPKDKTYPLPREKRSKAAKPAKAIKSDKKQRIIFMIGDEGAVLVFSEGSSVLKRLFAPTADAEHITAFRSVIEENSGVPIFALVDMMDQSYVKQTLPPVTKISVQKLIKRRLERDFGPEDITGAMPLGRESGGRKDWNYLLISVAGSPQLMQWLDFMLEFDNPFEGIYLVPIEAIGIIRALSAEKLGKEASTWQLLVCHNKVGGFRQVIFKDGRLTFTRLAQPIGDTSPEVVAGNIEQEIGNTIEYLKRLSYNEDHGLDCFLIVSSEIKRFIDSQKIKVRNICVFTPFEASELLKLNKAAQPEDHYADVVFATYFGMLPKKVLPLQSSASSILARYRKLLRLTIIGCSSFILLLLAFTAYNIAEIIPKSGEIDLLDGQIRSMTAVVGAANQKVSTLPPNIDRMDDVVSLYTIFDPNKNLVIDFIKDFYRAADHVVVVQKILWKDESRLEDLFNQQPPRISIEMDVEFTESTGSVDAFALKAKEFFARTKAAFPQYTMTYSKLPGIIDQAESFRTEFQGEDGAKSRDLLSGEPVVVSLRFVTAVPDQGVAP